MVVRPSLIVTGYGWFVSACARRGRASSNSDDINAATTTRRTLPVALAAVIRGSYKARTRSTEREIVQTPIVGAVPVKKQPFVEAFRDGRMHEVIRRPHVTM